MEEQSLTRAEAANDAAPSLYRRILRARFEELPPILQRFHGKAEGGHARGEFVVERGHGRLSRRVATLLALPDAGERIPVHLQVVAERGRERWIRHFGTRRMETIQWEQDGLLMESYGHTRFSAELVIDGRWLHNKQRRVWFLGIPLPSWLSPRVDGSVRAGDDGWLVIVRLFAPIVGLVVHYEGWVVPE